MEGEAGRQRQIETETETEAEDVSVHNMVSRECIDQVYFMRGKNGKKEPTFHKIFCVL